MPGGRREICALRVVERGSDCMPSISSIDDGTGTANVVVRLRGCARAFHLTR